MKLKQESSFNDSSSSEMLGWIEDMYNFGPRRPGTDADHRCEDYLADKLLRMGFPEVRKDPIPMKVWEAHTFRLSLAPSKTQAFRQVPAFYIPYTAFTRTGGVTGRLLYVKPGIPQPLPPGNWKGRIVVAEINFPHFKTSLLEKFAFHTYDPQATMHGSTHCAPWVRLHWTLYHEAVKRGAAGFIGILADHYTGGQNYYAPYGFKEKDIHNKPIPGFWVDKIHGASIRKLAEKGAAIARLELNGTLQQGLTHNVIGTLPGQIHEHFVLACHHDAPFSSAVEDASGCAAVLSVANHFAQSQELKRSLTVVFTAGHFYGSIGTRTFIERNRSDLLHRTALEFHVEHIAREAVDKPGAGLEFTGRPEFTGAFISFNRHIKQALVQAIRKEKLTRTIVFPAHGPFGDYPPTDGGDFHLHGVPLINYISPPIYLLNQEDTLDKVAVDRLEPTARSVIRVLRRLDGIPLKDLRCNDYFMRAALMKSIQRIVHLTARAKGFY